MKNRNVPILWLAALSAYCLWLSTGLTHAQSSNATYTLMEDLVTSGGGELGGGNPMKAQTSLGLPATGAASNGVFSLIGGIGGGQPAPIAPITMMVTVTGAVDDPSSIQTVAVNSIAAIITGTTFSAANVLLTLGPNTLTAVATDRAGNSMSKSATVYLDLPPEKKTPRFSIQVTGTVDEVGASVAVNGVPATITSGQFAASVPLTSGLNTLTAVARDPAGNSRSASLHVFVPPPTTFPPMPTVGTVGNPIPQVTTASSLTIGGTKTAGTAIWINGQQVGAVDNLATWSATLNLVEGDNDLTIVARDATGASSAEAHITIIVDNLPPVVTFQPPAKTNLTPAPLHGAVDDSKTTVTINGVAAARTKRDFNVAIPLAFGSNTLHLVAISPNGYRTERDYSMTLGHIPTIQTVTPADGSKLYLSVPASVQIMAADQENDPIECQVSVDGTPLGAWVALGPQSWTPQLTQAGVRRLTVSVRDAYGGVNDKAGEVYVLNKPVEHP